MPTANQSAHSGTVMMKIKKSTARLRERWAHRPVLRAEEILAHSLVSSIKVMIYLGASVRTGLYLACAHRAKPLLRSCGTFVPAIRGRSLAQVHIEPLAGDTRIRVPPSFHAVVAITGPKAGTS